MAGRRRGITTKLYVGYLPETCRKSDLMDAFEAFGHVVECDIVKNYAFVHYGSDEEAKAAVAALDDQEFLGVKIKVELSTSRVRQKPGMGGKNECYRCGEDGHWSRDCPTSKDSRERGGGKSRPDARPYPDRDDLYARDPYLDPYADPYHRDRYLPPPPRYRPYDDPYARRRLPPPPVDPRDPYYLRERDPYVRPPPDYYARRSPPRDPYYLYERRALPPPRSLSPLDRSRERDYAARDALPPRRLPLPLSDAPSAPYSLPSSSSSSRSQDSRPLDARPLDTRTLDARTHDARSLTSRPLDSRPFDARPLDSRPFDARPLDSRSFDARPLDSRSYDTAYPLPSKSAYSDFSREKDPYSSSIYSRGAEEDFKSDLPPPPSNGALSRTGYQ